MAKEWGPHEIIVEGRNCLARINITELHEWRFVLRLQHERKPKVTLPHVRTWDYSKIAINWAHLRNMLVFFVFLAIIVDKNASHTEIWNNRRMLFLLLTLSGVLNDSMGKQRVRNIPKARNWMCLED
jgi:hypothetical protein